METVKVDEDGFPPGVIVVGFKLQVGGNDVGAGDCTEQDKLMAVPLGPAGVMVYMAEEPAVTVLEVGCELRVKAGPVIVSVKEHDVKGHVSGPPPGTGLKTSTVKAWADAWSAAVTWALMLVEVHAGDETVWRDVLSSRTTVPFVPQKKFVPVTVMTKPFGLAPAAAVAGLMFVSVGAELSTVKGTDEVEDAPFATETCATPPFAMSAAGMVAVHWFAEEHDVVNANDAPLMRKLILEVPTMKPFPFTAKAVISGPPALAVKGVMEVMPKIACPPKFKSHAPRP